MKTFRFIGLVVLALLPVATNAQLYQDVSSSTAAIVRDPARQASTEIDAVINNPAGTAFLKDGWHFSLSGRVNRQNIDLQSFGSTSTQMMIDYIPSLQAAYKKNKVAISLSYSNEGGYGKISNQALDPMLTYYLDRCCNNAFESYKSIMAEMSTMFSMDDKLYNEAIVKATQYNRTFRLGASVALTPKWSVYAGVRLNSVREKSSIGVYRSVETINGTRMSPEAYFTAINKDIDREMNSKIESAKSLQESARLLAGIASGLGMDPSGFESIADNEEELVRMMEALRKEMSGRMEKMARTPTMSTVDIPTMSGWTVTPVLGVDFKTGNFNFAAKYEFDMKVRTNGDYESFHIPAILSAGASWKCTEKVALALGGSWMHINKSKSYAGSDNRIVIKDNDMIFNMGEYLGDFSSEIKGNADFYKFDASISVSPVECLTLSAGYSWGVQPYQFKTIYPKSITAGKNTNRDTFSGGINYKVCDNVTLDVGISYLTQQVTRSPELYISKTNYNRLTASAGINVNF